MSRSSLSPPADSMNLALFERMARGTPLESLLPMADADYLYSINHGDLPRWRQQLASLPPLQASTRELTETLTIGEATDATEAQRRQLTGVLEAFIPWRKGPLALFGINVDTEWRSDWKWERLRHEIAPLTGRRVLDVGAGNGYSGFRMLGDGAELAVCLDPHLPYVMQFHLLHHYTPDLPIWMLPVGLESLPLPLPVFDTVFSMGVLYHRRSPFDHLLQLKSCLRSGGELVLETLVVDGDRGHALTPDKRYCRMANVWFVPSCATAEQWLRRCGFTSIRTIDVSVTTIEEQRATDWMPFGSLADGLREDDPDRTIEGLPAPKRAVIVANAP